jgi:hypothetical protein
MVPVYTEEVCVPVYPYVCYTSIYVYRYGVPVDRSIGMECIGME